MEHSVDVVVTAVTVYPDRARVVCQGQADLAEGAHVLVIGELPLALEPESVRAQGAGSAHVRLRSVDVTRRRYTVAPSKKVQELEEALEERRQALQAVHDARAGAEATLAHLDGMRGETEQYARGLARGQSTVEDQVRLLAFFEEQDARMRSEIRDLGAQAREIQREIDKLAAELEQLRSARPRQRYEVRLDVEVLKAGTFNPEISYVVNQAGWRPLYDMRFLSADIGKSGDEALRVTYLAEVSQDTGQPWNDVRLTVSTARPSLNQRMPELRPWYVDAYQPPQPRPVAMRSAMAKEPLMAMADMAATGGAALEANVAAEVAVAEVSNELAAVTFTVVGGVDIPSDGTPQKSVIGQFDLEPEVDYFSAPRHTSAVYRRATVKNTSQGPLLDGQVNLFVGDEFIGSNALEYTPINGELELVLGVEERIEVDRELKRRDVDKRFLRDSRQIAYGYEITLHNRLARTVEVTVEDQYPVSRHDQIKIKLDAVSPAPVSQSDLHILEWRLSLPAGSDGKIAYQYTVEHPRDMRVQGLVD